jgi:APA family basic amino acid/polyamine antiporter
MVPLVPILGTLLCLVLMLALPSANWLRLLAWLALGFCIYWFYGRHHSVLAKKRAQKKP